MKTKAIIYTSNTGYTARYAQMLGEKTGLPVYDLKAAKTLSKGTEVVYLGWLMAGKVKGYAKAARRFSVQILVGVGLGDTGAQIESVRAANRLPVTMPLFTLQGGMDHAKLRGVYRSMIDMLTKFMAKKKDRTADEEAMLALLQKGGDYVSEEHLSALLTFIEEQ